MAVKVMLAPVIAKGDVRTVRPRDGEARPRRRRSSVYDADGNEVFITLMCLKCHKMRPLSQFGLRRMADGAIRNQPWCRTCRSGASAEVEKRRREMDGAPEAAGDAASAATDLAAVEPQKPLSAAQVAAQVAAAIAWQK